MRSRLTLTTFAAVFACALLPMKTGGCGGSTACITISPEEYAKRGGCPPVSEMEEFFFGSCNFDFSNVLSIDGEGSYDGQLCCYPVTKSNNDFGGIAEECTGGVAGAGGFGGAGGGCASCAQAIAEPGIPPIAVCSAFGGSPYGDLSACACASCVECELNLCKNVGPTAECLACLAEACVSEVAACESEL